MAQRLSPDYPGSRWWKFDFHTHTPASHDTPWHREDLQLEPQDWLLKFMAKEIDCVAITDHNSGVWIDRLKEAYEQMKIQAEQGQSPAGFRELTLFPGVEISANGGVHLLALFDPTAATSDIDTLLGRVGYEGAKGDTNAETQHSLEQVIQDVLDSNAIPIPAHADDDKGLLRVEPNTRQSSLSATMIKQALEVKGLLAVEWKDLSNPLPQVAENLARRLARVLGSDCHSFKNSNEPGESFTWVKMAHPTLEGLRLALLDGNDVSIRRSDEGSFDPYRVPVDAITGIEIKKMRYMGNGTPAKLTFSPFFNAIIGGRGTGKSTVVHALRLAMGRYQELGQQNELRTQFDAFHKNVIGADTVIRVYWWHEKTQLQLRCPFNGKGVVVEEWHDGQWQASPSQNVNRARFPVQILSQGQVAELASSGRQTLLSMIDEAANVGPLRQVFEENKRTFLTLCARLRELDSKLLGKSEVERKLGETTKKLEALSQTDHAAVLRDYAQTQHQIREMKSLFDQIHDDAKRVADLTDHIGLDDWPSQYFTEQDDDLLAWRKEIDSRVELVRANLREQAKTLGSLFEALQIDTRFVQWTARTQAAQQAYTALQQQLVAQGVDDPKAFDRLTQERQQLEAQNKTLQKMQDDRQVLAQQIEDQRVQLTQRRKDITQARQSFVQRTLTGNRYVKITVEPFGFDPKRIERELRNLVDVLDERFAEDILQLSEDGEPCSGIAFDLAQSGKANKERTISTVKQRLLDADYRGHFRNYLQRKHEKPDFKDHIQTWFPEDDLRIKYQHDGKWVSIEQGSQGQRSAALLAFLLAFGNEPIVLDQPEDDLDNYLIYDLIVQQIRENKLRRQLIIVTHNPNVVVNGDAELVHVMEFGKGQCFVKQVGALQESPVRGEVCRVMEGGREAFARRWKRLGSEG
ncbi:MAG: AAA family ATPase [Betaproteobacteria bacterium]|nr:AAA family ATPase [Betaproteobacteria bacterium]